MRQLEDRVYGWTGDRLETLTLDRAGLTSAVQRGEPIVEELRTDAILIFGPDLDSLTSSSVRRVADA